MNFQRLAKRLKPPVVLNQRRRRWWKLPMVWIDPVRGYGVAWLLEKSFELVREGDVSSGYVLVAEATKVTRYTEMFLTFFLFFVVVWVQTRGREKNAETLSPGGFLAGMMWASLPFLVAQSVIVLGLAATFGMGSYVAGYLCGFFTLLGVGYFFVGSIPVLACWALLLEVPLIISWLRHRRLVVPVRG